MSYFIILGGIFQYKILHYTIMYYEVIVSATFEKKVSITLDEDVIEKIRLFAEETDRSFSQYINLLLRKHISAREARDEAKSDE